MALAKASGASCGRLCPMPPVMVAMLIPADVLLGIDARVSMRCAVRVAFQCDRRTSDSWKCRDLLLQTIVFSLAGLQAQIPAIVVERDTNEIRIFKRLCRALERFVIERPFRRGLMPDEPVEVLGVLGVTSLTAVCGEIKQIPPFVLSGLAAAASGWRPGYQRDSRSPRPGP